MTSPSPAERKIVGALAVPDTESSSSRPAESRYVPACTTSCRAVRPGTSRDTGRSARHPRSNVRKGPSLPSVVGSANRPDHESFPRVETCHSVVRVSAASASLPLANTSVANNSCWVRRIVMLMCRRIGTCIRELSVHATEHTIDDLRTPDGCRSLTTSHPGCRDSHRFSVARPIRRIRTLAYPDNSEISLEAEFLWAYEFDLNTQFHLLVATRYLKMFGFAVNRRTWRP